MKDQYSNSLDRGGEDKFILLINWEDVPRLKDGVSGVC